MCQPLTTNLWCMEKQRQDMDVVHFLSGLKLEYEPVLPQVLCSFDLLSIHEIYSRLQCSTISEIDIGFGERSV
jgi:hypothetical protein